MGIIHRFLERVRSKQEDEDLERAQQVELDLEEEQRLSADLAERVYKDDLADAILMRMKRRPHDPVLPPEKMPSAVVFELGPEKKGTR